VLVPLQRFNSQHSHMYVSFDALPASARIWVYQAQRSFSDTEAVTIAQKLHEFCNSWKAHGTPLQSSFALVYNRFLILAVDPNYHAPSGCSIDSSVGALRNLGAELNIDFFDRMQIGYFEGGQPVFVHSTTFKELVATGQINGATHVFNNLIQTVGEIETNWLLPAEKTWLAKYLKATV
jgi:hypothetical protein